MNPSASLVEQLSLFTSSPLAISQHDSRPLPPPRYLGEAIELYHSYLVASSRAAHTVQSTSLDLRGLVEHLGDGLLVEVSPEQLKAHVRWLRVERRNGSASLRRKIATLKTFFRFTVASGWLPESPAAVLVYPPPQRPRIVALDPGEVESVVTAAANDPSWHALLLLLLDAGLKRDEALALQAEDLYLAREPGDSRVVVRHAAQAKRVRRRSVPLTPRAHFALVRLLQAPFPGGPLFSISVRGVNFVVETVGRRAGIARLKKLTPEILRDTFAVRTMRQRVDAEIAAQEGGASARELDRLRSKNDLEVLQLLGLSRYSDMATRYRAVAAGSRSQALAGQQSEGAPGDGEAPSVEAGR